MLNRCYFEEDSILIVMSKIKKGRIILKELGFAFYPKVWYINSSHIFFIEECKMEELEKLEIPFIKFAEVTLLDGDGSTCATDDGQLYPIEGDIGEYHVT